MSAILRTSAPKLQTTQAPVDVGQSPPPTLGQTLIATDSTHATWQTSAGSSLSGSGTTGTLPIFTSSSVIGDSAVTQVGDNSLVITGPATVASNTFLRITNGGYNSAIFLDQSAGTNIKIGHIDGGISGSAGDFELSLDANNAIVFGTRGIERMRVEGDGSVGIGPSAFPYGTGVSLLIKGVLQLVDGSQAAGNFLTSDTNGVASWVSGVALDANVVHSTGELDEEINGTKTFKAHGGNVYGVNILSNNQSLNLKELDNGQSAVHISLLNTDDSYQALIGYESLTHKFIVSHFEDTDMELRTNNVTRLTLQSDTNGGGVQVANNLDATGDINTTGVFRKGGSAGASGSFTTVDLKTVTVSGGIITSIV